MSEFSGSIRLLEQGTKATIDSINKRYPTDVPVKEVEILAKLESVFMILKSLRKFTK